MATTEPMQHLQEVDEALARIGHQLDPLIDVVLDERVSDYPIVVWQRGTALELGVLFRADVNPGGWEVRLTTLEELVTKGLMLPDRVAEFRRVYADARGQYGLFVVTPAGASFAFRPRG